MAPSRPTITVLVTAIAIWARLAAASGPASASVARHSSRIPVTGSIWFSFISVTAPPMPEASRKRKGPDRYRRGPESSRVGCVRCTRIPSGPTATPLDPAVLLEIEDRAPDVVAEIEVERCGDDLVVLA